MLVGRCGDNAHITRNENGKDFAVVSIATNNVFTTSTGERRESTEWHRVVFFGYLVNVAEKNLIKGMKISIMGRLQYNNSVDNSGVAHRSVNVICEDLEF